MCSRRANVVTGQLQFKVQSTEASRGDLDSSMASWVVSDIDSDTLCSGGYGSNKFDWLFY